MGRGYRFQHYELGFAPQVVALWDGAFGKSYPLRERVLRQNIDLNPNFRSGDTVTVWAGQRLVGFGLLQRYRGTHPGLQDWRDQGWLAAVAVAPGHRRRGLGTLIHEWLLDHAVGVRPDLVGAGGGLHHFFPGAPADLPAARPFLEALGFQFTYDTYDVRASLAGVELGEMAGRALAREGLAVRPAGPADPPRLLDLLEAEFGAPWWYGADWFFRVGGQPADWLLLERGDELVGMVQLHHPASSVIGPPLYWDVRGPAAGGLGPMGIIGSLRGRGLGTALLQCALAHLQTLGVNDAVADWTVLLEFYGRAGFRPWKRYAVGWRQA